MSKKEKTVLCYRSPTRFLEREDGAQADAYVIVNEVNEFDGKIEERLHEQLFGQRCVSGDAAMECLKGNQDPMAFRTRLGPVVFGGNDSAAIVWTRVLMRERADIYSLVPALADTNTTWTLCRGDGDAPAAGGPLEGPPEDPTKGAPIDQRIDVFRLAMEGVYIEIKDTRLSVVLKVISCLSESERKDS